MKNRKRITYKRIKIFMFIVLKYNDKLKLGRISVIFSEQEKLSSYLVLKFTSCVEICMILILRYLNIQSIHDKVKLK